MPNTTITIEKLKAFLFDLSIQTDEQRMELLDNLPKAHDGVNENVIVEFVMCGVHNALREFMDQDTKVKYEVKEPTDFIPQ